MATRDELYSALQKADAAGDTAGATTLAAYIRSMPKEHVTPQGGGLPLPDDPTNDLSGPQRVMAGMGQNLAQLGRFTGNKLGLVSDQEMQDAEALDRPLLNTPGGAGGAVVGNALWSLLPAMGSTGAVSRMGRVGEALAANPISRGALEGAVQGGLNAKPGETGKGTLLGASAGAALPAAVTGMGKLATGLKISPEAALLRSRGIDTTPGQNYPSGNLNALESDLNKVWGLGPALTGSRKQAETQFRQLLVKEAAAPGAQVKPADDIGTMLEEAYKSYGPAYDKAKGFPLTQNPSGEATHFDKGMTAAEITARKSAIKAEMAAVSEQAQKMPDDINLNDPRMQQFEQRFNMLKQQLNAVQGDTSIKTQVMQSANDPYIDASDATRRQASAWLENQMTRNPQTSDDLLALRSTLRQRMRSITDRSEEAQAKRAIYENAEHALTEAAWSQLPASVMKNLAKTDAQYAVYKTIENAVGKNLTGDFTMRQAAQAVRESLGKNAYARGAGGSLRELTDAGMATFVDTPSTGARAMNLPLIGGAIKFPLVGVPGALGLGGLTLTKGGRALAAGETAPQKLMRNLGNSTQLLPAASREAIAQLLSRGNVAGLDKWLSTKPAASD